MSRLTDLLRQVERVDADLAADLRAEVRQLAERRPFGLNFERHQPEAVDLPGRAPSRGAKVRLLPPREDPGVKAPRGIWVVVGTAGDLATLAPAQPGADAITWPVADLVVVAEFRDPIYPGLVSTGSVRRGSPDQPAHTVINGENFHALEALTYTHAGTVDAIYIDPPYNTGARDWKYNNDYVDSDDAYRHSKWLAMMERRLLVAKQLLNPESSVLIVTIDEKEYLRLGLLLHDVFREARIQMVSSQINPAAVARAGQFGRSDEYIYVVALGDACPVRVSLSREWVSARGRTHTGTVRWDLLRRSGEGARRRDSPGCFYPIYVESEGNLVAEVGDALPAGTSVPPQRDGLTAVMPIRRDGSEGRWQWTPKTFRERHAQGRVRVTGSRDRGYSVSILKDGEYAKVTQGDFGVVTRRADGSLDVEGRVQDSVIALPGTQWRIASHDSTQYGTRLLQGILPGRTFPFPKSLHAVEDALRFFVADKPEAIVLDFFAGSGTTAHAVMRLNKQDGGRRLCISVTNNEVGADEAKRLRADGLRPGDPEWERLGICDYITKPRIEAAITGRTSDGEPIKRDYKFTQLFPMSEGFEANAEFFTLTYESPRQVAHHRAFERVAPLLWLRAGAIGRRIEEPSDDFDVADTYAILFDLDASREFIEVVAKSEELRIAYVVTDDDRAYQDVCAELPEQVEPVRLYSSYLANFTLGAGS